MTAWMQDVIVTGGRVVTSAAVTEAAIRIRDGQVAEIGDLLPRRGELVVSATGCLVLPGVVDLHVHLADDVNGVPLADDLGSGTEIAICHGVTTVCTFATQRAGEDLDGAIERMTDHAAGGIHADIAFHLTPTGDDWDWDGLARLADRGLRTVKLYTTYADVGLYTSYPRLEYAMRRLAHLGLGLLVHCEDEEVLRAAAVTGVDPCDPRDHGLLRPAAAEIAAVERVVHAAARSGCRTHIVHVSTAAAAQRVAVARSGGAPVTGETGPQYLLLDDSALSPPDGHRRLCTPPPRPAAERAALEAAWRRGDLDLLATDHCPFSAADKDAHSGDFRRVPNGLPGVGALLDLAWELVVNRHGDSPARIAACLGEAPARIAGLESKGRIDIGSDADLVILDPAGLEREIRPSLSNAWSPWTGRTTSLNVRHVLLRGHEVVRDGALVDADRPLGRVVTPRTGTTRPTVPES
jgi:dihydropyrimidinase